mmetsp:Transcript_14114/g.16273  ORF Transcript_14114/g.16273 Transcript_14114/m.16273 type:complete len:236 (-) Transcript_14114:201-908(-)
MQKKDLYAELGLPRTCSQEEIKKAYKKLALQWHPDKNQDRVEEATAKFQMISEAYAILSDDQKRARYDKYGTIDENDFNFEDFMNEFDFTDIFGALFDMQMMMDMMGMAMKPGKMNGRRMKNIEKQMQKKYEAQSQKMFEKMAKEMFMDDGFDDDFDFGMGGFGAKKNTKSKPKAGEDEEWETEEEATDEEDDDNENGKGDNDEDYEDVDSSDEDTKMPKYTKGTKNGAKKEAAY